ncbi:transcription factor HBP-1b(c1)-like isoform X1 [Hordeum vulgare subsp. vulgare]|uniref:transcription factor HBP-1b(c1)-like isoform X1 n=1 Tax=Hordeum vulgare subsp. vulgare TaxID=112509 RepID=UPI001D1A43BF|nr:transcription factor HBP-1b(c1)-like isoform X1 [Hordeum vulgare subsp. vulgare]
MDYGTDASTDPDVDKNQEQEPFEQGHAVLIAPSDPSGKTNGKLGPKTLRRLAQNREAARRSRLRKKAYVQQLESSSLKLAQLEQELRRARQQGFLSTLGDQADSENASSFYVEYGRWLEGQLQKVEELRAAVSSHADDSDLQAIVDTIIARWDEIFTLKGAAAKADAFHVLSGAWTTPVERFFLWLGGFRPSEFLKVPIVDRRNLLADCAISDQFWGERTNASPCLFLTGVDDIAAATREPAGAPHGEAAGQYRRPATFLPASRRSTLDRDGSTATVGRRSRRGGRTVVPELLCSLLRRWHGRNGCGGGKAWRPGRPPAAGR